MKRHAAFILPFTVLALLFFWPILGLHKALLYGDYRQQFYPWLSFYAESLKAGHIPLWTPLVQCGFPLFAEGQTGMLYFLNILFFYFLPFKTAYSAIFIFHYILGALFFYAFALKKGMSSTAASLATLAFVFGSTSAGGFLNLVSLRTLVWFPLALLCVEHRLKTGKILPLFVLSFVLGQSWLAGSTQMAGYSAAFTALYYSLRIFRPEPGDQRLGAPAHGSFLLALGLSVLIGLPQLWATTELASVSSRMLQDREFALWGSVAPWSAVALFFHSWNSFFGINFYVGILPLFCALFIRKQGARTWWWMGFAALFLALGHFNPVYWLLLRLPLVSLLRDPSKFLFFAAFALAVLAGMGWDSYQKGEPQRSALRRMAFFTACLWIGAFAACFFVQTGQKTLHRFGEWYVQHWVAGKSFHREAASVYVDRLDYIIKDLQQVIGLANPWFWWPLLQSAFCIVLFLFASKRGSRSGLIRSLVLAFVSADLAVYGLLAPGTSFVGNFADWKGLPMIEGKASDGRWMDLTKKRESAASVDYNMTQGAANVGLYAPLVDKDYFFLTRGLGIVDDSMGREIFQSVALGEKRGLINFMGVAHVLSDAPLGGLGAASRGPTGEYIYENPSAQSEFSWNGADEKTEIIRRASQETVVRVDSRAEGLLRRNALYDKGWKVYVDGIETPLQRIETAFQGVTVPKGKHEVRFTFSPDYFTVGRWFFMAGLLISAGGILWAGVLKK